MKGRGRSTGTCDDDIKAVKGLPRESASAKVFRLPGMCRARMKNPLLERTPECGGEA